MVTVNCSTSAVVGPADGWQVLVRSQDGRVGVKRGGGSVDQPGSDASQELGVYMENAGRRVS